MVLAGAKVRASDIPVTSVYFKAAGESVTSSTTAQDDNDIAIPLEVGLWAIDLYGAATGAAAGDIKLSWSTTGTMTLRHRGVITVPSSSTDVTNSASVRSQAGQALGTEYGYGTDGANTTGIREHLVVEVTVAGTLTLRWAQLASSGTATTLSTQTHAVVRAYTEV